MTVFATLPAPYPPAADGALAFDRIGRFGYRLLAATGRSGGDEPAGGVVYTIDPLGHSPAHDRGAVILHFFVL